MNSPKVSIIIPHYRGHEILMKCIKSIRESTFNDYEVIIVDNNSTDSSLDNFEPNINESIVKSLYNRGYAGGCNLGAKNATGKYLIFLNNDTEHSPDWIEPLIDTIESDSTISSVQPKLLSYYNRNKFDYAGGSGGLLDYLVYPFARGRIFSTIEDDKGQYNAQEQIFWASGTCFITRRELFKKIGGFDEALFAHMEEIDYHWRCQLHGYRVFSNPKSVIFHKGGQTLSYKSFWKKYYNHRNSIYLLLSNYSLINSIKFLFPRIVLELISFIYDLITLNFKNATAHIYAWLWIVCNINKIIRKRYNNKKIRTVNDHLLLNSTIFSKSIVVEYFINKKKNISEL